VSAENVELVREGLALFNRGDFDGSLETLTPEPAFVWDTRTAVPDGGVYHGVDEVRAYWESIAERWDDFRIEPEEFVDVDADTVLMLGRLIGRGTESRVPVESTWDQVWRFRDGVAVACENHSDRARARRSAGAE
jgi:ketosteroid isomerase-like protein